MAQPRCSVKSLLKPFSPWLPSNSLSTFRTSPRSPPPAVRRWLRTCKQPGSLADRAQLVKTRTGFWLMWLCYSRFWVYFPFRRFYSLDLHKPSQNLSFCSGKIVSPKWKSFKGLRLLWRDKIRLNNAIWRAWFIQCESALTPTMKSDQTWSEARRINCLCYRCASDVEKRKNPVCGFVTPLEGSEADAHRKPEVSGLFEWSTNCTLRAGPTWWDSGSVPLLPQAIVLEGSYWKQRIEVVIKEYHKWRIYYKKRASARFLDPHWWTSCAWFLSVL